MTDALEGLQLGALQYARVKCTPCSAKRSKLGVRAWGCPDKYPAQSFISSIAINNTFGVDANRPITNEDENAM